MEMRGRGAVKSRSAIQTRLSEFGTFIERARYTSILHGGLELPE
jgi:hypothetical protein